MSTIEATNARQIKRRRRRRNIAELVGIAVFVLGCVAVPASLLGLAVFIVRYAWTLGGSL